MHAFFHALYEKACFRDPLTAAAIVGFFIGQGAIYALIALHGDVIWGSGNTFLYLHYKVFMGVDYFARWYAIFLLPLSGLVCGAVNYAFARAFAHSSRSSAQMLMICTAIFQYFLLFALYLLIQINIF